MRGELKRPDPDELAVPCQPLNRGGAKLTASPQSPSGARSDGILPSSFLSRDGKMPSLLSAELPLDDLPQFLLHIHRLCGGGAAPLARIVPSSSFVCDDLRRARRPALTGPSGGGLGIASVRSPCGQPAAGYLRFAPVVRPTRDAHLLHGHSPGVDVVEGLGPEVRLPRRFMENHAVVRGGGGDVTALKVLSKMTPLAWNLWNARPMDCPGARGGTPWGGQSEPPGWCAGALGHRLRSSRLPSRSPQAPEPELWAAKPDPQASSSQPKAASSQPQGCARPPPRSLVAAPSRSRPPRSIDTPAPSSGLAPQSIDRLALDPKMHR